MHSDLKNFNNEPSSPCEISFFLRFYRAAPLYCSTDLPLVRAHPLDCLNALGLWVPCWGACRGSEQAQERCDYSNFLASFSPCSFLCPDVLKYPRVLVGGAPGLPLFTIWTRCGWHWLGRGQAAGAKPCSPRLPSFPSLNGLLTSYVTRTGPQWFLSQGAHVEDSPASPRTTWMEEVLFKSKPKYACRDFDLSSRVGVYTKDARNKRDRDRDRKRERGREGGYGMIDKGNVDKVAASKELDPLGGMCLRPLLSATPSSMRRVRIPVLREVGTRPLTG